MIKNSETSDFVNVADAVGYLTYNPSLLAFQCILIQLPAVSILISLSLEPNRVSPEIWEAMPPPLPGVSFQPMTIPGLPAE